MQYELEQIKRKPFAVPGLGRVASAPCLALPSKLNDSSFFDPSIVRLNSSGIVGRDTVWEVAAKLLAAANISEAEVELLPKTPMARGYRLKFTTPGPTAATQSKQMTNITPHWKRNRRHLARSLRHYPPRRGTTEKIFVGLDRSRLERTKSRNFKSFWIYQGETAEPAHRKDQP